MVDPMDMAVLSVAGLLVSMGLALTGFGMDTIYILVWQIAVLSGYDSLVKAPVIQAISLFSVQPLLLSKAEVRKHASRQVLWYFIPVSLISTLAGMATVDYIHTELIFAIEIIPPTAILVTFMAVFELYRTYDTIFAWFPCYKKERNAEEKKTDVSSQAGEREQKEEEAGPIHLDLGFSAKFWTLFAGFCSGYLGGLSMDPSGLCGIRGPPIILYFLHPPYPASFGKNSQRATGVCITFTNVLMRVLLYGISTLHLNGEDHFTADDWPLYVVTIILSNVGVLLGSYLFVIIKDSQKTIKAILSILLALSALSLLIMAFGNM
jgi:uncharacterized membrane protein YfcA